MTLVCIQCAMRALLAGEPSPVFDETAEEHAARAHPDPVASERERRVLEARLAAMMMSDNKGKGVPR